MNLVMRLISSLRDSISKVSPSTYEEIPPPSLSEILNDEAVPSLVGFVDELCDERDEVVVSINEDGEREE